MAIVKMNAGASQEKVSVELTKADAWILKRAIRYFLESIDEYEYLRKHFTGDEYRFPHTLIQRIFDESIYWEDEVEECEYLRSLSYSVDDLLTDVNTDDVFD